MKTLDYKIHEQRIHGGLKAEGKRNILPCSWVERAIKTSITRESVFCAAFSHHSAASKHYQWTLSSWYFSSTVWKDKCYADPLAVVPLRCLNTPKFSPSQSRTPFLPSNHDQDSVHWQRQQWPWHIIINKMFTEKKAGKMEELFFAFCGIADGRRIFCRLQFCTCPVRAGG